MTRKIITGDHAAKVPSGVHAMRRGGTRREVTERVTLTPVRDETAEAAAGADGVKISATLEGWALNVSRGGLRAILEDKVVLGQKFEITVGSDEIAREARVVWVQEEPDGVIVGLEFTNLSGTHKSAPPPPPPATPDEGDD